MKKRAAILSALFIFGVTGPAAARGLFSGLKRAHQFKVGDTRQRLALVRSAPSLKVALRLAAKMLRLHSKRVLLARQSVNVSPRDAMINWTLNRNIRSFGTEEYTTDTISYGKVKGLRPVTGTLLSAVHQLTIKQGKVFLKLDDKYLAASDDSNRFGVKSLNLNRRIKLGLFGNSGANSVAKFFPNLTPRQIAAILIAPTLFQAK